MAVKRNHAEDVSAEAPPAKRLATEVNVKHNFRSDLFESKTLKSYTEAYTGSKPYTHGVIENLITSSLLRCVRDEITTNISFTPKETDIYKIHQSGDLANLDGLDDTSLRLLPSLVTLRDSLYSPAFREYLAHVTDSGPLSGRKTDMAVNIYTPGCHLLCHDDVIGSRRVSYILYLTDPDRPWRKEWGGALRLYPTRDEEEKDRRYVKVPHYEHTVSIPPAFGQLSFFAVQPGESFHDVEEVYARRESEPDDDGGRFRMAISGWYHIPQEGEDGYEQGAEEAQAERSSLAQLQGKSNQFEAPQPRWVDPEERDHDGENQTDQDHNEDQDEEVELTESDLNFLLRFINARYLTPDTVGELNEAFSEDSSLRIAMFLSDKFAASLRTHIGSMKEDNESLDDSISQPWRTAEPPHKHRYQFRQLDPGMPPPIDRHDVEDPLSALWHNLFPSLPFRKWLSLATGLSLSECNVLARRFRRGKDYTLATSYDEPEPQLEVCLGITPTDGWGAIGEPEGDNDDETNGDATEHAQAGAVESTPINATDLTNGKTNGEATTSPSQSAPDTNVGGYEVYMAGDNDSDADSNAGSDHGVTIPTSSHTGAGQRRGGKKQSVADPAIYKQANEDAEDDGVLFSMPACWNTMSLVLRDRGTLRFVKYISAAAKGDRWDVVGAWKVDDEDEDADQGKDNPDEEVL